MRSGRRRTLTEERLGSLTRILTIIWTVIFVSILGYEIYHEGERVTDTALHQARAMADRDLFWDELLGERLFPVSGTGPAATPVSEPVLSCMERGENCVCLIVSDSAWRSSRVFNISLFDEYSQEQVGRLLPPATLRATDNWEDSILALVPAGSREFSELIDVDDHTMLRFLSVNPPSSGSDAVGRGTVHGTRKRAVSMALPMNSLRHEMWAHISLHGAAFTLLWLFGVIVLRSAHRAIKRGLQERLLMEAALRDNEDRFERIATTEHVGIWEIDAHANTTFVNHKMAEMLGSTIPDMLGSSMFDFMSEDGRQQAANNFERRKQFVEEQHEFRFIRNDGTFLHALLSTKPILGANGEFNGALGIITDIGDRKTMENALRSSEERLRLLLESTEDVITMIDLDGRLLYQSAPGSRYGTTPEQIIGRNMSEIVPPEIAERQLNNIRTVASTGEPLETGERILWKGEEVWFQSRLYPVRDESGVIKAVSSFSRNVTELKRAQEMLRQAEESLEMERLRSQIAGDLHDDIGSTLSSTSIFGELLSKEITDFSPRATELLSRIAENLSNVQQGLHEIVWTINPENDSLDNLLLRLQEHASEVLEGKGIALRSHLPEGEALVSLSMQARRDLHLMFKEAIHNIVKHANATEVSIGAELDNGCLRLTVADNGEGFDTAHLVEGNGLRNMKRRVEATGGTMELNANAGSGTTVVFRVPIA